MDRIGDHMHVKMKNTWRKRFAIIVLLLLVFVVILIAGKKSRAQSLPAFYNDIQAFKKLDEINSPAKGKILFIGSSSFTYWKDVHNYFPENTIINRGFGGSTLVDQIRYQEDIIYPYKPRQIVIYCGENDIASSDTISVETVVGRFKQLFSDIRSRLPKTSVVFVSMKPSPSRWHMQNKVKAANDAIRIFLSAQKRTAYVDVYTPMLKADGRPVPALFLSDSLHMTASGYAIWKEKIAPKLIKK